MFSSFSLFGTRKGPRPGSVANSASVANGNPFSSKEARNNAKNGMAAIGRITAKAKNREESAKTAANIAALQKTAKPYSPSSSEASPGAPPEANNANNANTIAAREKLRANVNRVTKNTNLEAAFNAAGTPAAPAPAAPAAPVDESSKLLAPTVTLPTVTREVRSGFTAFGGYRKTRKNSKRR